MSSNALQRITEPTFPINIAFLRSLKDFALYYAVWQKSVPALFTGYFLKIFPLTAKKRRQFEDATMSNKKKRSTLRQVLRNLGLLPPPARKPSPGTTTLLPPEEQTEPPVPPVSEGEPEAEAPKADPRKGCFATLTYTALVMGLAVLLAGFLIISANDVFALVKADREVTVVITDTDTIKDVSKAFGDAGLIRYPSLFRLFADVSGLDKNIAPGEYTLNANMDYRTLLRKIQKKAAGREVVTVVIPEGMTQKEIFALLEEKGVCEAWRLQGAAQYYDYSYSFVKDLPYSPNRLEGYLFPDTYNFYVNENPISVVGKFLANFNRKMTVDMKARAENMGYSIHEIVIIASMIEREAKYDEERPLVSSVIYNRLKSSNFPYLQIDATVQYALPEYKEVLTDEDLAIDSPYNTYKVKGLPAGPISNPGLAAIRAALYPDDTDYYYYVVRKNGYHYFSKTLAEHQKAIQKAQTEVIEETDETARIEG